MTTINPAADISRERAHLARAARTGRARLIRRRVVSGALALFVAAWLLIAVILVSGHDPALSKRSASTTGAASSTSQVTSSSQGSTDPSVSSSAPLTTRSS